MSTEQNNKEASQATDQQPELTEMETDNKQDQDEYPDKVDNQADNKSATNVHDKQAQAEPDPVGAATSTGAHQSGPRTPSRSGWIFPLLAMFVLLIGGGVLLWLEQQQLGQRLQQSEQYSAALQTRLDTSQQQQLQTINANSELQRSIQATQALVTAQQQAPQQDESSLILHQALMLVRMAQAQLQVRHNVTDALLAMQWAQERLQAHSDSDIVAAAVTQLERDIQQLRNLPERNNLALVQQLVSLIDSVDNLPLRVAAAKTLEPASVPEPVPATPEDRDWRSAVQAIWQELKQLVVIRHRDQPLQPVMSAERKQILHDVLRLRLEALQVQLMRDAGAAQNVVRAHVLSWLREWFDEGSAEVITLRDWLNNLPQPLSTRPDLQASVSALTTAISQTAAQSRRQTP